MPLGAPPAPRWAKCPEHPTAWLRCVGGRWSGRWPTSRRTPPAGRAALPRSPRRPSRGPDGDLRSRSANRAIGRKRFLRVFWRDASGHIPLGVPAVILLIATVTGYDLTNGASSPETGPEPQADQMAEVLEAGAELQRLGEGPAAPDVAVWWCEDHTAVTPTPLISGFAQARVVIRNQRHPASLVPRRHGRRPWRRRRRRPAGFGDVDPGATIVHDVAYRYDAVFTDSPLPMLSRRRITALAAIAHNVTGAIAALAGTTHPSRTGQDDWVQADQLAGASRVLGPTAAAARPVRLALAVRLGERVGRHRSDRPTPAGRDPPDLSTARRPPPERARPGITVEEPAPGRRLPHALLVVTGHPAGHHELTGHPAVVPGSVLVQSASALGT